MEKDQQGRPKNFPSEHPSIANVRGISFKYLLGEAISTRAIMFIENSEKQWVVEEILPSPSLNETPDLHEDKEKQ